MMLKRATELKGTAEFTDNSVTTSASFHIIIDPLLT